MKPILTGRIVAARSGSQLNLRYGAPGGALPFFLLWYFLVAVVFIGAAYSLFTNRDISSGIILLVIPLFAGVPIAFHHWGTNRADEDLAALLEFLRLEAEANPTAN